jgi:ribonucleotide monophosphatase NagD (HAD superfamily)
VVGGEGLVEALEERGLSPVRSADDDPVAVVQGFDRAVGWEQLAEGAFAVRAGAIWVAANLDLTLPTVRGIAPGNGTLVRAVATAVGRDPDVVAGKPYRPLFDETVRRIASQRPLVVGDRLDTDIEGAVTVEADSLLVMTGVTDVAGLCHAAPHRRPSYVAWTLDGLLRPHGAPSRRGDGAWELSGWVVRVDDGAMGVDEKGQDDEAGLAVVAAASWDWGDGAGDRGDAPGALDLSRLDGVWEAK